MKMIGFAASVFIAVSAVVAAPAANAQARSPEADAAAGRALALQACTGCHVVLPDQPFKPVYHGLPRPPDFKEIANRPNITAVSLEHHIEALPQVPQQPGMANPNLSSRQLWDVVAFIMTLRDKTTPAH